MATEQQLKEMKRPFHPEMLDEPDNVSYGRAFLHDYEVNCTTQKKCTDPAHYRLLNLHSRVEITDTAERIEAMRKLWHEAI